jgi:uncharacterized membrane protein YccF (DUF307 family)
MKFLGNLLWLVLGGFLVAMYYWIVGILTCITIIGIPFGVQLIKIGTFALWPFGHEVVPGPNDSGCLAIVMNVVWILVGGIEITMLHLTLGVICSITIVGIPFGIQHFKMGILALTPFGKRIS